MKKIFLLYIVVWLGLTSCYRDKLIDNQKANLAAISYALDNRITLSGFSDLETCNGSPGFPKTNWSGKIRYNSLGKEKDSPSYDWDNCVGIITYANASIYKGEFKDGKMHGRGILRLYNGYKYVGTFIKGEHSLTTTYNITENYSKEQEEKDNALYWLRKSRTNTACGNLNFHIEHTKIICIQDAEKLYDQNRSYKKIFAMTSLLINTDDRNGNKYKVKNGQNAPYNGTHDVVNRARIQLGMLYAQGYGVSKNIKKALDLWNLVLEDWKNAQSLQIENAKFLIGKFETKTVTQVNADNNQKASKHLQTLYFNYLSVKGCHDLGSFYIDDREMETAKKHMRNIENQNSNLNTDKIWKDARKDFDSNLGAILEILKMAPTYDANFASTCKMSVSVLRLNDESIKTKNNEKDF